VPGRWDCPDEGAAWAVAELLAHLGAGFLFELLLASMCVVLLGGFQMRQLGGWSDVMAEGELFGANEMPLDTQSGISRREDMLDYRETRRGMMAGSAGKKKPIFVSL